MLAGCFLRGVPAGNTRVHLYGRRMYETMAVWQTAATGPTCQRPRPTGDPTHVGGLATRAARRGPVACEVAELIPDVELEVLPAGHAPWLGHPPRTAALVAAFVR